MKKMMVAITGMMLAVACTAAPAYAGDAASSVPPAEQHLIDSGSRITARFVSASGLRAVMADNGQDKRLFYLTPDGNSLIFGAVFDAAGNNLTLQDMQTVQGLAGDAAGVRTGEMPGTTPSDATLDALWSKAGKLSWIAEGAGDNVIYAVFDPNCPYCHSLHGALRPAVTAGKVQVRWIPVSILAQSGAGLISAMYAADDQAGALSDAFNHILGPTQVTPASKLAMAHNLLLLRDTGYAGVPLIVYKRGGHIAVHPGLPDAQTLTAIIGL